MGGASIAFFGVAWLAVQRVRGETLRPLQPPPAILLGDVPSAVRPTDLSPQATRDTAAAFASEPTDNAEATPATPRPRARGGPPRVAVRRSAGNASIAVLPGDRVSEPPSAPAPDRERQTGTLRISVDQPRDGDAAQLFAMAVAAHRAGDLASARALYDRVLLMTPNDVDALNNMGVLLSAMREFGRAELLLRRAISLSPRNASVWSNLGTVLRESGQSSDAVAAFQHALSIEPTHQGARVSLAQQYLSINMLAQARVLLEEVVAVNPAVPEAQYALGQVLELQGDKPGALRAYNAFIRVAPARFAAHVERVRRRVDALSASRP